MADTVQPDPNSLQIPGDNLSAPSSPATARNDCSITPLTPSPSPRVEVRPRMACPFSVVVAIDFGTTSSGYAFSFTQDSEAIHMMKRWEGGDPGVANQKSPTCLLLTPDLRFHSFGFAARDFYHDVDPEEARHWLYFDKFKMKIHSTSDLTMETELEAVNGRRVRAIEVFAHALRFFREHALKEVKDQSSSVLEGEEIRWVITVPAVWRQPAKQFMREAAYLDERLACAHQAEAFTRQIQNLQSQLRSVQEEMDSLEEEKESELAEAQEELRVAQEEVLLLQQVAEEAAAERENDIASLQEELCRRRAELQRLSEETQEYELEITTLRAEISMKSQRREAERREGDVDLLKEECRMLREECQTLKEDNRRLTERLQLLQRQRTCSSVYLSLKEEDVGEDTERKEMETGPDEVMTESYMTMAQSGNCRLVDASIQKNISFDGKPVTPTGWNGGVGEIFSLRDQLKQAEEKASQVQKQCDGLKTELQELQVLYDSSQRERAELEEELQRCKAELEKLSGGAQRFIHPSEHPVLSIPFIGMIVIVAVVWCWLSELASQRVRGVR